MKFKKMITAIDSHTEGEPARVVIGGIPDIPGNNMFEKKRYGEQNLDQLRTLLMYEPRGHSGMSGSIITQPTVEEADMGIVFIEVSGWLPMCGHGTIAACTVLVETGIIEAQEPVTKIVLDTPAGIVRARVKVEDGSVRGVTILNVPSFLYQSDVEVDVPTLGRVKLDIAWGGNFYAILPAESVGLEIAPEHAMDLIDYGRKIRQAIYEQVEVAHPENPLINRVTHVRFLAPPTRPEATMKNAVIYGPGQIDRSPCGTGTSAEMAARYAKGQLNLNEEFISESIIGTLFYGKLVEEAQLNSYKAVVPTISGRAYIMGIQQFVLDPKDPFPAGFYLGKREKLFGGI